MRLLIVDDQVLFRQGLVGLINTKPEFEVVGEASSVNQAIEMARQLQPDLILMDFNLPDGTGLEATQAILNENPESKIVFLTIYETDDKLLAAIRLGAKGYMLKNVQISKLLNSLKAVERGEPAISRQMTGRIIEAFSQIDHPQTEKSEAVSRLSRRERDIMQELAEGLSNREIADRLVISENTVKHHIHNILGKLELSNRHDASEFARQNGLHRRSGATDSYS
jgi:DNA-binding NarL/FixJ family response regulator